MNAHTKTRFIGPDEQPHSVRPAPEFGHTQPDGSMLVTVEQLKRVGLGDVSRGRRELRLILGMETDRQPANIPIYRPASVRVATERDEAAVLQLILLDLQENAVPVAPASEARIMEQVTTATRKKGGIMGVIDGPDGTPVALVLIQAFQWWWSNAYYLQEQVTFVHPDHRKSNHMNDLLMWARWITDDWTRGFGYRVYLLCGVLATKRVREKIMLYRRKFRLAGAAFLYPSPDKSEV